MTTFRRLEMVKTLDSDERVQVVEVIPVGLIIFYRIEYESGALSLVPSWKLRSLRP
jgi:hypothetical protein